MVTMQASETLESKIRRMFEASVPFNQVLGLKVHSIDPAAPQLRFDMRPELIGNPRRQILHGGVISAAAPGAGRIAVSSPGGQSQRGRPRSPGHRPEHPPTPALTGR